MKKLLTLLITVALASQLLVLPASAKIVSKDDHSWKVVNGLGLADFSDTQKEEKVTRAEFAKFVAEALGITIDKEAEQNGNPSLFEKAFYTDIAYTEYADAPSDEQSSVYNDVVQGTDAYDAIYALKKLEIMSGDGSGNFYPDRYVKYEEVLKTFVVLASYNVDAKLPGSWSYGYVKLASDLDIILKGVSQGTEITKQQLLRIFYNLFDVEMLKMIAIVDGNAVYEKEEGVTFLNEMIGLYCFDGRLDATANSTVYLPYETKRNTVVINSITYGDKTRIPLGSMLGREVEAYRTEDGDVVYMTTTDDDEVEVISADDVNGCVGGILSYEKNGREKTENISGLPVIYNGVAITAYDENVLFNLENGNVTLIEYGEQDIVSIWNYKDMYIGSVIPAQNAVYDEITGYRLNLDENNSTVHIYDLNGNRLSFDNLTTGSNLTYIENGSYKEVYIYESQIEGVIKQINQGEELITVDEKEYNLTNSLAISLSGLSVGTSITAYVNMFGEIFFIEEGKMIGQNMGYIVKAYLNDDEEPMLKMFCKDGEFVDYRLADKVNFTDPNNNSTKPDGTSLVQIINGNSYYDVCTFFINADECITKIQMALKSKSVLAQGEDKLYKKYFGTNYSLGLTYEKMTGIVSHSVFLTAATKIYEIPSDRTDYESYNVRELSELTTSDAFNGYAYYMDDGIPVPRALVIEPLDFEINLQMGQLKLVTKLGNQFVDDEDRICVEAEFITAEGTKSTSYCVIDDGVSAFDNVKAFAQRGGTPKTHKIGVGDLVFCSNKPNSNELSTIRLVFSAQCESPTGPTAKKGWIPDITSKYYTISKSTYNKFKAQDLDDDILSYLSYNSDDYDDIKNPMRISSGEGKPILASSHDQQASGTRIMLGYAVDSKDGYLKLTTQDLSIETYNPNITQNIQVLENCYGVKYERYYNTMRLSTVFYLVELYDNGIVTRKADPTSDIMTYKKAGKDCSKVLVLNDLQYFIINDYRTR